MHQLTIGFSPGSDAELLAGIPIVREFRRRGHRAVIALDNTNPFHELLQHILATESETSSSVEAQKETRFDALLFHSTPLRSLIGRKVFDFGMVSGLTTHALDKLKNIYLFGSYNLAVSPSRLPSMFDAFCPFKIPVIGMPTADLHKKWPDPATPADGDKKRKYFLYPDSAPFSIENRRWMFNLLAELATCFPDYDFLIKERFSSGLYNHIPYIPYRNFLSENTPENLKIAGDGTSTRQLIDEAQGLLGIHSGALWQGMLSGKPVAMIADPPEEKFNGVTLEKENILAEYEVRWRSADLVSFIKKPKCVPAHILKEEVPFTDASSRIVDLFESVFTHFANDARLPWVKIDLCYDDDFDKRIFSLKQSLASHTASDLKRRFLINAEISRFLSDGVSLYCLLRSDPDAEELGLFYTHSFSYKKQFDQFKNSSIDTVRQCIRGKGHEFLADLIENFFNPDESLKPLADNSILSMNMLSHAHYLYVHLKKAAPEHADLYFSKLSRKHARSITGNYDCFQSEANKMIARTIEDRVWPGTISSDDGEREKRLIVSRFCRLWIKDGKGDIPFEPVYDLFSRFISNHAAVQESDIDRLIDMFSRQQKRSHELLSDILCLVDDWSKSRNLLSVSEKVLKALLNIEDLSSHALRVVNYRYASLLSKLGRHSEVISILHENDFSDLPVSYRFGKEFYLGKGYYELKNHHLSLIHIKECLHLCPDHTEAGKVYRSLCDPALSAIQHDH